MWEDVRYSWVVVCKNDWVHRRQNLFSGHKILLGEADPFSSVPRLPLGDRFAVRCDDCGKEYLYKTSEVRRSEQEVPNDFTPHPLFRN